MHDKPFRPPPAGVIRGESIPRENAQDEVEGSRLEEVANQLRARGAPYADMSDRELRERAQDILQRAGEQ